MKFFYTFLLSFICAITSFSQQSFPLDESVEVEFPLFIMEGVPFDILVRTDNASVQELNVEVSGVSKDVKMEGGKGSVTYTVNTQESIEVAVNGSTVVFEAEPIPLWWSIIPPLLAIALALIFREVVSSLFLGVFFGASILYFYSEGLWGLVMGFMRTIDHYIVAALSDSGHVSIIIFSMLIGAMVAIISKNGGMQGVVDKIAKYAQSPKSGQLATWILGIAIFFDDYANTLVVGNTMRPVTDRLKVSREKLAYIVDSTAAPIAAIAFVTTWIGAELGYIESGIESLATLNEGVYATFFNSLQYSFYPIFTLGFVLMIIMTNKDFSAMHRAEVRARTTGVVSSTRSKTYEDQDDLSEFTKVEGAKARWYNAVVPVLVVILGTMISLIYTGWNPEIWHDSTITFGMKLSGIIGNADSYLALLWSSMLGVLVAGFMTIFQRIMSLEKVINAATGGFKTMLSAIIILTLAWSLAEVTKDLHTAHFLSQILSDNFPAWSIPVMTFVLAALVAFSTGSSWGTMAILYPLILPAAWLICEESGMGYNSSLDIFHNVVASVLAGSVLGDHCSPISDTTILSSLASSCNHIDHVKTQLPYALCVGAVAIFIGILPAALGISSWILFPVGFLCLYLIIRYFGKVIPAV